MQIRFEFATAGRIVFGAGARRQIGSLAKDFGKRAFVVTGRNQTRAKDLTTYLQEHGITAVLFSVPGEPEIETVTSGVRFAKEQGCEFVIGLGGGSAIDAGKAIAAMLTNSGDVLDYLEVIGQGKALTQQSAPMIAVPTTAGTGSEVTRNAVLGSPAHRVKASLRSPLMLPRIALVDPELSYDLPPDITSSTGLDALTQLIEPFVSSRANPMTDALCVEGIPRVARSMRRAFHDGRAIDAREDMAIASLFGGLALANAGLGAVHGFAGPIGGMFPAPHGAICAALLPHVMTANIQALQHRAPHTKALARYDEVARLLTGRFDARAEDGVEWVRELVSDLRIPPLATYGIAASHFSEIAQKAIHASSMKANPIELTSAELQRILESSL